MVQGFLVLLLCQLLGEAVVIYFDVPIPGAVVGMALLLIGLILLGKVPEGIEKTSLGLLSVLPLLLVPAGVGLMNHFGVLSENWLAFLVILFVSTLVTMFIVGVILKMVSQEKEVED